MISIKNLSKTHINNKHSKVLALNNISLDLPDKGLILLNGESGSGKTTLLNILGGLDTFDTGSFTIDDKDIGKYTQTQLDDWRGKQTAFVFQAFNLISAYSVSENVKLGKNFQGYECSDEEVSAVLKTLKLEGYEERFLKDLSGGENQRVAIARALVRSPRVLIVDEPTGQIDEDNSHQVMKILDGIAEKTLVICVSHETSLVSQYADRIITLKNGKILSDKKLTKQPKETHVVIEKPTPEPIEKRKHLFQLGLLNLTKNKFKTVAMILLSCLSILFFSTFFLLSGYDRSLALAMSAKQEGTPFVVFDKQTVMDADDYDEVKTLSDSDLYKYVSVDWFGGLVKGIVCLDPPSGENIKLGLKLITPFSKYPDYLDNDTKNKVVITDYIADTIIRGTADIIIRDETDVEIVGNTLPDISNLIGKKIYSDARIDTWYEICGIVETDYLDYDDATVPGTDKNNRFLNNLENQYAVIYTDTQFIRNIARTGNASVIETVGALAIFENAKLSVHELGLSAGQYSNATVVNFGARLNYLNYNEDVFPAWTAPIQNQDANYQDWVDAGKPDGYGLTAGEIQTRAEWPIKKPVPNNSISNYFRPSVPYSPSFVNIAAPSDPVNMVNGTQLGNGNIIISEDIYELWLEYNGNYNALTQEIDAPYDMYMNITFGHGNSKQFTISGIIPYETGVTKTFMVSDHDFNSDSTQTGVLRDFLLPATKLLMPINDIDDYEFASIIRQVQNKGFVFQSATAVKINDYSDKLDIFKTALLIFAITALVFTCFLLYNFVLTLILERRKDLAVLRSLGATSKDIATILFSTVGAISLICFIISSVLTVFLSLIVNAVVQASLAVPFAVIAMNGGLFGLIFLICVVVCAVATIVPIYNHSKQTPTKQLKG